MSPEPLPTTSFPEGESAGVFPGRESAGVLSEREYISVGQLQRKAKNALAREFRGPVWVTGEIRSIRDHRGSLYITLVEPGDYADGSDTTVDVAAWARRAVLLHAQLGEAGVTLAAGMQVRICGNATLSKLGKLMVELTALDVEALLGNQAAEKRKLYAALAHEKLLDANKHLPVPFVPLRIGLVTSENSEGCNDFLGQFQRSGYAFEVTLVHSPVQGPAASSALARAITQLHATDVDLIALVRGGGGELDAFDKEAVARAIATSPIPVWTGIGHTGDHSVADDVAQRALVTPTECGQALVGAVAAFETRVNSLASRLHTVADRAITSATTQLHQRSTNLGRCATKHLDRAQHSANGLAARLPATSLRSLTLASERVGSTSVNIVSSLERTIERHATQLEYSRKHLGSLDPKRPLQRGYSLTYKEDGSLVTDAGKLATGDVIATELANGRVQSVVRQQEKR